MFRIYTQLCVSYPVEAMACFITTVAAIIHLLGEQITTTAVLSSLIQYGSIMSTFVQIKKVIQTGSLCVLLVVAINTLFSAIIFAVTILRFPYQEMNVVSDALPVLLLLIDFPRMLTLLKHLMGANLVGILPEKVAEGMGEMLPGSTCEVIFKMLSLASISYLFPGAPIQQICYFAFVALLVNYLVFVTVMPACLSLLFSWVGERETSLNVTTALKHHDWCLNEFIRVVHIARSTMHDYGYHVPHEVDEAEVPKVTSSTKKVETFSKLQQSSDPVEREEKCLELLKTGGNSLSDEDVLYLIERKKLLPYRLEKDLQDANRAVNIRRMLYVKTQRIRDEVLQNVPFEGYDFSIATKACCENTIGYIPVPIGLVGPLLLDDVKLMVPMATTEGTLLASTNRGLKALLMAGGVKSYVYRNGMSRSPVVEFPTVEGCCKLSVWLQDAANFQLVKKKFDETSRFARLTKITTSLSGRLLFIRFVSTTGDAMGMNMVSKGSENSLRWLNDMFPSMKIISLSGNFCTDKKPSAVNWIEGRGRSVVCEAIIPSKIVSDVLKTDMSTLTHLNRCKNHIGSAMAGSIGGFNAHAANIVTGIYIATGQDPAQVVVSANCMTTLEVVDDALVMTCTMPSVEVATVGGGTILGAQKACLQLLGVAGSHDGRPGENANQLARIVCGTVMGGELSLMSALSTGDLVRSHMKHNRVGNNPCRVL